MSEEKNVEVVDAAPVSPPASKSKAAKKVSMADIVNIATTSFELQPVDPNDPKEIEMRFMDYMQRCATAGRTPGKAGAANALGINRKTFDLWKNRGQGNVSKETAALLKRIEATLEDALEGAMVSNNIHDVSGIFLMKSNFEGYQEQKEVSITLNNPLAPQKSPEELKEIYGE